MIEHAVCFEFFHSRVLLSKNSWKAFLLLLFEHKIAVNKAGELKIVK